MHARTCEEHGDQFARGLGHVAREGNLRAASDLGIDFPLGLVPDVTEWRVAGTMHRRRVNETCGGLVHGVARTQS